MLSVAIWALAGGHKYVPVTAVKRDSGVWVRKIDNFLSGGGAAGGALSGEVDGGWPIKSTADFINGSRYELTGHLFTS